MVELVRSRLVSSVCGKYRLVMPELGFIAQVTGSELRIHQATTAQHVLLRQQRSR